MLRAPAPGTTGGCCQMGLVTALEFQRWVSQPPSLDADKLCHSLCLEKRAINAARSGAGDSGFHWQCWSVSQGNLGGWAPRDSIYKLECNGMAGTGSWHRRRTLSPALRSEPTLALEDGVTENSFAVYGMVVMKSHHELTEESRAKRL